MPVYGRKDVLPWRRNRRTADWILCFFFVVALSACVSEKPPAISPRLSMEKIDPDEFPFFEDDIPKDTLRQSVTNSLTYFNRLSPETPFQFGDDTFSASHMIESLETFRDLIEQSLAPEDFANAIKNTFWVYKSVGRDGKGEILFTGYYEPQLQGALQPSFQFAHPLYRKPNDWVKIDLSLFGPEYVARESLVGRICGQTVVPYYSREDIDSKGMLQNKGFELVWVTDPVELFFLHVQGSGRVTLEDGSIISVNYDGHNGRPYQSIGKLLIDEGKITNEEMSLHAIRSYLKSHPQDMQRIFSYNERYVFFKKVETGPLGAINVPLTPGRSIATDLSLFPKGAICYVLTEKPEVNSSGTIDAWKSFGRFVLNQDTGGAILGPGRVDFFWGHGEQAEISAGYMKHKGALFFLVKKPSPHALHR
jgi:membrane-bound lytic murein transglycosylase A